MLYKSILPSSFDFGQEAVSMVDVHSRGIDHAWMIKTAASRRLFQNLDLRPKPGHSFVHVIAAGNMERYGLNRNGDGLTRSRYEMVAAEPRPGGPKTFTIQRGNKEQFDTFMKYAKVFRLHKHTRKDPSYGSLHAAGHNDDMDRIELMLDLPNDKWEKQLQALASGKGGPEFSMGCGVPFDVCTICLNKAPTKKQYCEHAKDYMTLVTKKGNIVGVVNESPRYMDISEVPVGAEPIARALYKAASFGGSSSGVMSGVDLAEHFGFGEGWRKEAADKLAMIEKRISAMPVEIIRGASKAVPGDLPPAVLSSLQSIGTDQALDVLGALASVKVACTLPDFFAIVLGPSEFEKFASAVYEAERRLPSLFDEYGDDMIEVRLDRGILPGVAARAVDDAGKICSMKTAAFAMEHVRSARPVISQQENEEVVDTLLRTYAGYKVAWLDAACGKTENDPLTNFALLQHHVHCQA